MNQDKPEEIVAAFDRGDVVHTLEMGGIGSGYEQAIQVLMVELLRPGIAPTEANWDTWGDDIVHRMDEDNGFSGAQVGAAKWLANQVFKFGMNSVLARAKAKAEESGEKDDRAIMFSKHWPKP